MTYLNVALVSTDNGTLETLEDIMSNNPDTEYIMFYEYNTTLKEFMSQIDKYINFIKRYKDVKIILALRLNDYKNWDQVISYLELNNKFLNCRNFSKSKEIDNCFDYSTISKIPFRNEIKKDYLPRGINKKKRYVIVNKKKTKKFMSTGDASLGVLLGAENNKIHFFPKDKIKNKIFKIPNTKYGISICGVINNLVDEDIKDYDVIFNPSLEKDDLTTTARYLIYKKGLDFPHIDLNKGLTSLTNYINDPDEKKIKTQKFLNRIVEIDNFKSFYLEKISDTSNTLFIRTDGNLITSHILNDPKNIIDINSTETTDIYKGLKYKENELDLNEDLNYEDPWIKGIRNIKIKLKDIIVGKKKIRKKSKKKKSKKKKSKKKK